MNIKYIFSLAMFIPLFVFCQNGYQTVNHNGVSVQIPLNWGSKNTTNYFEESDITEFQISCWSKEKSISLIIQWIDTEIEDDFYIETLIEMQQERFPIFRQLEYGKIEDADFLNIKAKRCHFRKYIDNDGIEGEYIAFTKNQNSYIIGILGSKDFHKSNDYNRILNSIKPSFSNIEQQKKNDVKITATENNFTRYEFNTYSLSIPNTMELRDENSIISLGAKIIFDKIENIKKIDIEDFNPVFQPSGTDDASNLERWVKALDLYARIMINHKKGDNGDFFRWNDDIAYTQEEYNQLNEISKNGLLSHAKQTGIEVVKIDNIQIAKNVNKFVYIKQPYIRKGLDGDVKVLYYYIYNNSEMVELVISYRISDSIWESDFDKIINTFSFITKKQ